MIRPASLSDIPGIVKLENSMWSEAHACSAEKFALRMSYFNEGLLLAISRDEIVGSFYGIIRPYRVGQPQNWLKDSGDGTGSTHDPKGNALFGISITVGRSAPAGTFRAIVEAWRELARAKGLTHIYGAARAPGMSQYQGTPDDYMEEVKTGKRFDPVVSKLMACGSSVGILIPDFFEDPESRNFGVEHYAEV